MINIRYSIYETNSSSVHALVIPKDTKIYIPKTVNLYGGDYGWREEIESDTLNYFYQACLDQGKEEVEKFFAYLRRKGVEEINAKGMLWDEEGRDIANDGYVDHAYEIPLDELFKNEQLLDRFLFGSDSYVHTGNDNSDMEWAEEIDEGETNDVIWKWN